MNTLSGGEGAEAAVAEIQGLYGPFSFPEKLLQQIWQRGDFDLRGAVTCDGRAVEVLHPGRWNRLGGPDFKQARLRIGDSVTTGDVEVHLRGADWYAHGHAGDAAYADVVLHVVLFPSGEICTAGYGGRGIPVLVMLPLLHHDLEEYAADAAVERLANHPWSQMSEELTGWALPALRAELWRRAGLRWGRKVHYARLRVAALGWEAACHQTALEILGYGFNRPGMLAVAGEFVIGRWREAAGSAGGCDALIEEAYGRQAEAGRWSVQGVRPLNQPRVRLGQYARWIGAVPGWPDILRDAGAGLGAVIGGSRGAEDATTADYRRAKALGALRERLAVELCGGVLGGPRLDTVICDGFLPLVAARGEDEGAVRMLEWAWRHWYLGDVAEKLPPLLRRVGVIERRDWPASHGIVQGLLDWLLSKEARNAVVGASAGRGT